MKTNPLHKAASIISAVFSPLLVPTYALLMLMAVLARQFTLSPITVAVVVGVVFLLTGALPFMIIRGMMTLRYVRDVDLTDRRERTLPFVAVFVLYVVATLYLYKVNLPLWMLSFMFGGTASLVVATLVSLRWKISAHASAMGALVAVALVCSLMLSGGLWLLCSVLLVAGMVGTARLLLGRHTPAQVYAGWLNGFVPVVLFMYLVI